MKNQKLTLFIVVCLMHGNIFATFYRETRNAGKYGYKTTLKEVRGNDTTIHCFDPGYDSCPENSVVPDHQPLIDHAIYAIRDGLLSGTYSSSGYTVNWNSDDTNLTNSTITVN